MKSALLGLYSLGLVWFSRVSRASPLTSQAPQELGWRWAAGRTPTQADWPAGSSGGQRQGPGLCNHSVAKTDPWDSPHTGPWTVSQAGTPSPFHPHETSPLAQCCHTLDLDTLMTPCGKDRLLLQMGRPRSRQTHKPGPEPDMVAGLGLGNWLHTLGTGCPTRARELGR